MNPATKSMEPTYRFSGHETFPCRYTWLPKAVRNLRDNPTLFSQDAEGGAMVQLGVGKNMVRAIRFWADAAEVVSHGSERDLKVSDFGNAVFGPQGYDKYLEDIRTLWLIHWKLSSATTEPLFAWHYLLNFWHRPDFTPSEAMAALAKEAQRLGKKLSAVTLDHHFTTFLHTYVPTRTKKGDVLEDNLDCPLIELELIEAIGERTMADSNRRETIYAFRVEEKPEISAELFTYCLADFWNKRHPNEQTLSFRDVAVGLGSPGQVFKLPEHAVRDRLETLDKDSDGKFVYQESAAFQQVKRLEQCSPLKLLKAIYKCGTSWISEQQ